MTLCFFLKFLGEFSFYFFLANTATALMGSGVTSLGPLFLLSAVGALAFALYRHKPALTWLPLLLLPLCFFFTQGVIPILAVLLPCVYLAVLCHKQAFWADHAHQQDHFAALLKVMAVTLPLIITMSSFENQPPLLLPLFLLFLFSNIFLLRMLRHTPENLEQFRFKTVNTVEIGLFLALIFLVSTPFALSLAFTLVKWLFQLIVTPILTIFMYAVMAVVWVFDFIVGGFQPSSRPPAENPILNMGETQLPFEVVPKGVDPGLAHVVQTLFTLTLLVAAFFFFRRLLSRNSNNLPEPPGQITRSPLLKSAAAKPPADRFPPKEPRAAVRYYYRRFLRLCMDLGLPLLPSINSSQVLSQMEPLLPKEELLDLRKVYIKARYSRHSISKEEAQQAKELYQQMKAASKEK